MSYSQFRLEEIKKKLGISFSEIIGLFSDIVEVETSQLLKDILQYNVPLAIEDGTEKARSELIVSPILVELKKQLTNKISLFSGRDFNVDLEQGLNGRCDFLISRSPVQLLIEAPVIAIVEAKDEKIISGLAQCIAEMRAAQLFNEREGNEIKRIYGAVTTGTIWKFMRLVGQTIEIDVNEYSLPNVGKILGILRSAVEEA